MSKIGIFCRYPWSGHSSAEEGLAVAVMLTDNPEAQPLVQRPGSGGVVPLGMQADRTRFAHGRRGERPGQHRGRQAATLEVRIDLNVLDLHPGGRTACRDKPDDPVAGGRDLKQRQPRPA
jgi:hypothetical protein